MTQPAMLTLQIGTGAMNDPRQRQQRRSNLRLGLLLAAIAVAIFIAILAKLWVLG